jgi:hypothetical protein
MTRRFLGCGFACAIALTASVAAQDPPTQPVQTSPPPTSSTDRTPDTAQVDIVTVEGCLMKEADVPGRKPPEDIRAKVEADGDYVLTSTKMIKGAAPSSGITSQPADTPVGTSGAPATSAMYEIEGRVKDQLEEHVGKRVQIDGAFQNIERAKNPVSFANDLVELRGTAIRPVAGDCPK